MQLQIVRALMLAIIIGCLSWMYNALPDQRALIIFSAIVGVGVSRH